MWPCIVNNLDMSATTPNVHAKDCSSAAPVKVLTSFKIGFGRVHAAIWCLQTYFFKFSVCTSRIKWKYDFVNKVEMFKILLFERGMKKIRNIFSLCTLTKYLKCILEIMTSFSTFQLYSQNYISTLFSTFPLFFLRCMTKKKLPLLIFFCTPSTHTASLQCIQNSQTWCFNPSKKLCEKCEKI